MRMSMVTMICTTHGAMPGFGFEHLGRMNQSETTSGSRVLERRQGSIHEDDGGFVKDHWRVSSQT